MLPQVGRVLLPLFVVALSAGCGSGVATGNEQPLGSPLVIGWDGANNRMTMSKLLAQTTKSPGLAVDSTTWLFGDGKWTEAASAEALPAVGTSQDLLVYDSDRKRELFISMQGMQGGATARTTWESDGHVWVSQATAHNPPAASQYVSAAYSPDLHATVLVDAGVMPGTGGTTWLFDGTDWLPVSTTHFPYNSGYLSYDPKRHAIMALSNQFVTWQFDGKDWSQIALGYGPTPTISTGMGRQAPAIAFDPVRAQWVVFGGFDGATSFADTWTGDETSWEEPTLAASPYPRSGWPGRSLMAWDPSRRRAILFGGRADYRGRDLGDTWSWDGSTWARLAGPIYSPPPIIEPSPASSSRLTNPSPAGTSCPAGGQTNLPLAVLVDFPQGTGPASSGYDLSLVKADGCVAARTHASTRAFIHDNGSTGGGPAPDLPEISVANGRVYYLDGDNAIRYLTLDGSTGAATTVPGSGTAHAGFAVSPDGNRIAVSVVTYQGNVASMDLYVEDMSGANHHDLFKSNSQYAWPVAWHAGKLVLAVGPAFHPQGLWDNPYSAASFHVVDPATAIRSATIGGPDYNTGCEVSGVLTPAGTACYHLTATSGMGGEFWLLDWTGTRSQIRIGTPTGGTASLNPDQPQVVAALDLSATVLQIIAPAGSVSISLPGSEKSWPCWIDDERVLVGAVGDRQFQPVIADASSGGVQVVQAHGFCAAILGGPAEVH